MYIVIIISASIVYSFESLQSGIPPWLYINNCISFRKKKLFSNISYRL